MKYEWRYLFYKRYPLWLGHDREFIWGARGYNSVEQMNQEQIDKINMLARPGDTLYMLGDIILGDSKQTIEYLKALDCQDIRIIIGNHDTSARLSLYNSLNNVEIIGYAKMLKWHQYHFYLSHYPTITSNMEKSNHIAKHVVNLSGHTHSPDRFYMDIPFIYNVAMDAHNGYPVDIETILNDIKVKIKECEEYI